MKQICLILLLLSKSSLTWCQQELELDQAITLAKQNSPTAQQIKAVFLAERWRQLAAQASLKPQLLLEGNAPGFSRQIGQVLQPDGSFLFRSYSRSASLVTFSLAQSIMATGGTISLTSALSRIDIFGSNRTIFWSTTPIALVLNQPLFRFNQTRWDWQQQKLSYEQSSRQIIEAQEDLAITVTDQFFTLALASIQLRNAEYNKSINDTLAQIAKSKLELGRIAESEFLQVELSLLNSKNAIEQYRTQIRIAERELIMMLGLKSGISTKLDRLAIPILFVPDPELALNQAKANRSDIVKFEIQNNQSLLNLRTVQNARQFNADLTATLGYNQYAGTVKQAYQALQGTQSVTVNFKLPLYTAGRTRALIEAAHQDLKATQAQIQIQQNTFELDIINEINTLSQLRNSLQLVTLADTIAKKRFQFLRERYLIGKTDITTLTFAQQEKDAAIVNYVQTLRNYWLSYYRLRRLTLYDFIRGEKLHIDI